MMRHAMRGLAVLGTAGVLALGVPGEASADEPVAASWSRHEVAGHPVSVELPGPVSSASSTTAWGPFGSADTEMLLSKGAHGEWMLSTTTAPMWALKMAGHGLVFSTTKKTVLSERGAKALTWEPVTRSGLTGRRLVYEVDGDSARRGTMEVFVVEPYILTLDTLVDKTGTEGWVERFFGSMKRVASE